MPNAYSEQQGQRASAAGLLRATCIALFSPTQEVICQVTQEKAVVLYVELVASPLLWSRRVARRRVMFFDCWDPGIRLVCVSSIPGHIRLPPDIG